MVERCRQRRCGGHRRRRVELCSEVGRILLGMYGGRGRSGRRWGSPRWEERREQPGFALGLEVAEEGSKAAGEVVFVDRSPGKGRYGLIKKTEERCLTVLDDADREGLRSKRRRERGRHQKKRHH